jgi:hypothetical protein
MTTLTRTRKGVCSFGDWQWQPSLPHYLSVLSWLMSDDRRRYLFDPLKDPTESFLDYLEGYASAMDMYPVCSRYLADHREYTLGSRHLDSWVEQFWRDVADDMASVASGPMGGSTASVTLDYEDDVEATQGETKAAKRELASR